MAVCLHGIHGNLQRSNSKRTFIPAINYSGAIESNEKNPRAPLLGARCGFPVPPAESSPWTATVAAFLGDLKDASAAAASASADESAKGSGVGGAGIGSAGGGAPEIQSCVKVGSSRDELATCVPIMHGPFGVPRLRSFRFGFTVRSMRAACVLHGIHDDPHRSKLPSISALYDC